MEQRDIDECRKALRKMTNASNQFYGAAIQTGNHAFIEFTGLMNEYITMCRSWLEQGIDFRQVSKHTGNMPIEQFQLEYLNEKLECIYGITFTPVEVHDEA